MSDFHPHRDEHDLSHGDVELVREIAPELSPRRRRRRPRAPRSAPASTQRIQRRANRRLWAAGWRSRRPRCGVRAARRAAA
jgi:hypothetical protein